MTEAERLPDIKETQAIVLPTQLIAKLKALGKISIEQKKQITCSLIGHSRIIFNSFGYVHCARCGDQIGDLLGGYFDASKNVIVGHKCEICVNNEKTLTWKDRYLAKTPFNFGFKNQNK